jgi:hypothetical protein
VKFRFFAFLAALGLAFSTCATAEVLHGIEPLSTLGQIKKSFPNARFKRVQAAWVKESESFYSMDGEGFPGELFLLFDDERPMWRAIAKNQPPDPPEGAASSGDSLFVNLRQLAEARTRETDDDALTINWVRWAPSGPIPMERVKAKYGEPSKCDFSSSDFSPFCSWESRALSAQTTVDRKAVLFLTASYTKGELRAAYKERGQLMPDWLKDSIDTKTEKALPKAAPRRSTTSKPTI